MSYSDSLKTQGVSLVAPLVVGYGAAGRATVRALLARGYSPTVIDDKPTQGVIDLASAAGIDLIVAPNPGLLESLVKDSSVVLPSPGVGDSHRVFELAKAAGVAIRGEFDLAGLWDTRPIVAITGTNGKTTVTTIVTDALARSGVHAVAAGNTDLPLVEAIDDGTIDVFVVEASSFRLEHAARFEPKVAAWLNFAPDHLDAHSSLDDYRDAKAKIWASLAPGGIAVANAEDETVMAAALKHVDQTKFQLVTFGVTSGTWHWEGNSLVGPSGSVLNSSELQHKRPHDLSNAAAVVAIGLASGASIEGVVSALTSYVGLPHRVEQIASAEGITWVNDSKATVPQATLAAVGGYQSIVLIAGGRNKGLPMDSLRDIVPNVRAVIAIGDAAEEIARALDGLVPVDIVADLSIAVDRAREIAEPGDTVLLSPACTSYDQYPSYVDRGEHFRRLVEAKLQ